MSDFRYNFKGDTLAELGNMYRIGKETWPNESNHDAYQAHADFMEQLFDEILIRWACSDDSDSHHRQGLRL